MNLIMKPPVLGEPAASGCISEKEAAPLAPPETATQDRGQLVDRWGHVHSEAVLTNWSPAALAACGVHRVKGGVR